MHQSRLEEAAAAALVRLGSDAVPALVSLLKDNETQLACSWDCLGNSESAAEAVPHIVGLLDLKRRDSS